MQTHKAGIDFQQEQTEKTNNPRSNLDKNKLHEKEKMTRKKDVRYKIFN